MKLRKVKQLVKALEITEGAGVTVHRTIGTPALRNLDPFLMLDHFSSNEPDDYIAGFPDHPHRGFITFTYMLDGHMLHRDSMGNEGNLMSGGVQWMKAARGVIHSEMPKQIDGLMRGFQLWINLPASEKMSAPEYQEYPAEKIPVVQQEDKQVKVLIGEYENTHGPIVDPFTRTQYFDIQLAANASFEHDLPEEYEVFIYVFEGSAMIGDTALPRHSFAVLDKGDTIQIKAGENGARMIMVAGSPIGEPIAQYGPFVMNTQEEIHLAIADYRNGQLTDLK